jgi:death on curing protein
LPAEVRFLSLDEVLAIHERMLRDFGGSPGVRDMGLLESALHRPATGYYETLPAMASALMESLLMNHAFVDGNKRVAVAATDVFLRLNGLRLVVDSIAAHAHLVGLLESGDCDRERLETWIVESMQRHVPRRR